jgi:DNA-binding response OmpR family regulator
MSFQDLRDHRAASVTSSFPVSGASERKPDRATPKTDIVIVDDHPIMAQAVSDLVAKRADCEVTLVLNSVRKLHAALEQGRVGLIILDLAIGQGDGVETIKAIRSRDAQQKVLVFSMHDEMDYAYRCVFAGARGYVMKDHAAEEVLRCQRSLQNAPPVVTSKCTTFGRGDLGHFDLKRQGFVGAAEPRF